MSRKIVGPGQYTAHDYLRARGTVNPLNPVQGQFFYRTDKNEWFYYDSSRDKWLSVNSWTYTWSEPLSTGTPVNTNLFYNAGSPGDATAVRGNADHGALIMQDSTVVGWGTTWDTAHSATVRLLQRDDSASQNKTVNNLFFSSETRKVNPIVNYDVDQYDRLYVRVVSAATASEGNATAWVRRRAD